MPTDLLTVKEASEFLRVAEGTVYKLLGRGELIGLKFGGSWRFQVEDLIRFGQRQGTKRTGPCGDNE